MHHLVMFVIWKLVWLMSSYEYERECHLLAASIDEMSIDNDIQCHSMEGWAIISREWKSVFQQAIFKSCAGFDILPFFRYDRTSRNKYRFVCIPPFLDLHTHTHLFPTANEHVIKQSTFYISTMLTDASLSKSWWIFLQNCKIKLDA